MPKKKKKIKKKLFENHPDQYPASEIGGLLLLSFVGMMVLSLISFAYGQQSTNWVGIAGNSLGWIFHSLFGITGYAIALYIGWVGWSLLCNQKIEYPRLKALYFAIGIVSFGMLLGVAEDNFPTFQKTMEQLFYPHVVNVHYPYGYYPLEGIPLYYLYHDLPYVNIKAMLNSIGVAILFSTSLIVSILFFCKISIETAMQKIKQLLAKLSEKKGIPSQEKTDFMRYVKVRMTDHSPHPSHSPNLIEIQPENNPTERPSLSRKKEGPDKNPSSEIRIATNPKHTFSSEQKNRRETALDAQRVFNGDFTSYKFPSLSLLTPPKQTDQSKLKEGLKKQAEVLEETLSSFSIEAKVGQINCGPTVTSFEVHPAIGVKVQKILSLENDIALNMEAKAIRILAPIPGKAAIGIEVPNPYPQEVGFKELLTAYQQQPKKFHIPLLLGKTVTGDYVMSDLAKMPHLIIAGATGSGKSVCINTMIMSLLFNVKPDDLQIIMVDPKKVELTPYNHLPHLIAPVITEPHGAYIALQWLVKEMETRYEVLKQVGVRNIEGFNSRKIDKVKEAELPIEIPKRFPFIVGIIDELADLMMVSSSDIETPIARIAQMARAVGIHLILATQRPSREVITGLIKANFPTRIAFKVSSRVNSQIILDEIGAESLLGNGDMLFRPPGSSQLVRAQGAFIGDADIHKTVQAICEQAPPNYRVPSFDQMASLEEGGIPGKNNAADPRDEMYDQALNLVLGIGKASATILQTKLKVGYARAARLMTQLEEAGVITPPEGSRPRRVIHPGMSDLDSEGQ